MTYDELYVLKFPIGEWVKPNSIHQELLESWIEEIEEFPQELNRVTSVLTNEQLKYRYRPNGWNIKQVVHHCADSHMNSFMRFKLALTEDTPIIKPYFEDKWAELIDGNSNDIQASVDILRGLHRKWTLLLRSLSYNDLKKEFIHPEHNSKIRLKESIGVYAWHGRHHLEHIRQALKFSGKFN